MDRLAFDLMRWADRRPAAAADLRGMLQADQARQLIAANTRENQAWNRVTDRAGWERFRDERIAALARTLGAPPRRPGPPEVMVTATLAGDGVAIENLVFATRPGVVVTANLYRPEPDFGEPFGSEFRAELLSRVAGERMPAVLLVPSHHNPKTQGELQDMGVNWARTGCLVLVPDMLGHGERRQQPFGGREDYHWRYLLGLQLDLLGEGLIGWMVWDLMAGLDVLLARPGVDRDRVIVVGSVAGGGDPAAVLAALDSRVTCSVPFNFGAAERGLPDPDDPSAPPPPNFFGTGSWESTRNLRGSAPGGFAPWVIVAAAAPRHFISAHEFEWDPDNDPAYQRIRRVYELYGAADRVDTVRGRGGVELRPPAATHCNNVGPVHRAQVYPALQRWFAMAPPTPEVQQRRTPEELTCLTGAARTKFRPRPACEPAFEMAAQRVAAARERLARLAPPDRLRTLREDWDRLLGGTQPAGPAVEKARDKHDAAGARIERIVLETEPGILVPTVLLRPAEQGQGAPVTVGIAYEGKEAFCRARAGQLADLLARGVAVCLPDLRGTGESAPAGGHAWQEEWNTRGILLSSTELMLGRTLLGLRLRDLRAVLAWLGTHKRLDGSRVALWGDSFAPTNPTWFADPPLKTDNPPHLAEPMGPLLALLGGLFEEGVAAVAARGGLIGYASVLASPAAYVPHDVIVPGVLEHGDVADVAAALAPRRLRLEAPVDGRNRPVTAAAMADWLAPVLAAYQSSPDRLDLHAESRDDLPAWLAAAMK